MSSNSTADLMVGNRPLSSLRVVDLKQELEKRGLSKSGSKKDLVDRLRLHLQIEKHRDTGASADEEELPNYSQVHDELADQNPFIRDYLASQAELFHSQKVVKKLVEEEAKRESETSADESVDSPMKQPTSTPKDSSPATETRRHSRRRTDSHREEMTAEKLFTRSSRSRSPAAATAPASATNSGLKANDVPVQSDQPPVEVQTTGTNAESPAIGDKDKAVEIAEETKIEKEEPKAEKTNDDCPLKNEKQVAKVEEVKEIATRIEDIIKGVDTNENTTSNSSKPRDDDKQADLDKKEEKIQMNHCEEPTKSPLRSLDTPDKHAEDSPEKVKHHDDKPVVEVTEPVSVAVTTEKEVASAEKDNGSNSSEQVKISDAAEDVISERLKGAVETKSGFVEEKSIASEDKEDMEVDNEDNQKQDLIEIDKVADVKSNASEKSEPEPEKKIDESAEPVRPPTENDVTDMDPKEDAAKSPKPKEPSEDSPKGGQGDSASSSEEEESHSRRRTRQRKSRSRSRSRSTESRGESEGRDKHGRSDTEENDEVSRDAPSPLVETTLRQPSRSRSRSCSPVRAKSIEKESSGTPEKEAKEDEKDEEEKMEVDDSASSRYKSSQKETSYSNNDIAGEEALDYGEEEDDEERNENDPQEFSWTRRILRYNNKPSYIAPTCKWKMEEDGKHLMVKSNLLNEYYEDIKLVPLEQLKLEEKSSEQTNEVKKEAERKHSTAKEVEVDEPLPTRTVENSFPAIKRTVSLVASTKQSPEDAPEEADRGLTPPRNPPSDVLIITNLVRPFTLIQLKEMLQRTGSLQDIWVDKIKSKCIAKFGSEEEAFETRAALHGVCWPNSNPKSLHVDYTTQDFLDEHKVKEGAEQTAVTEKPVTAQQLPVREWDVGKKEPKSPTINRKRSKSRSASRDRDRKRSRRSPSPGRRRRSSKSPAHERRSRQGEGKEPEPMGKALDELFRKTVATPSIYWLPLTPEQIAEKEELRRKRMLERERRLVEMSKMRPR